MDLLDFIFILPGIELVGPSKRKLTGYIVQLVLICGQLYLVLMVYLIKDWRYFQLAVALPLVLFLPYHWYSIFISRMHSVVLSRILRC